MMSWLRRRVGAKPNGSEPQPSAPTRAVTDDNVAQRDALRDAIAHRALPRALALADALLADRPDDAELNVLGGQAYLANGDPESAFDLFLLALHYQPDSAPGYLGAIRSLRQLGRDIEAEAIHREFRSETSADPEALYEYAHWHYRAGRFDETVAVLQRLIAVCPDSPAAHNFLGFLRARQFAELHEGEQLLRRALELDADYPAARCNLGWVLSEQGREEEAVRLMDEGIAGDPSDKHAQILRAEALLRMGRFERGWEDYDARWHGPLSVPRPFRFPEWRGERASDKRLLVFAEQGLGDQILFASCLREAQARVKSCVLECDRRLRGLMQRSFPDAVVVEAMMRDEHPPWLAALGPFDLQVPAGNLPGIFRRRISDFPAQAGYLQADPARTERWRERLAATGPRPWIGVSWRGGLISTRGPLRSIPLTVLAPALQGVAATWVNLQYGDCRAELDEVASRWDLRIHHWQEAIDDYEETAALVAALDLVVSVSTAMVDLVGSLGRKALVLLPYTADWRFGFRGSTMPWYPTLRLFRQPVPGRWDAVMEELRATLASPEALE